MEEAERPPLQEHRNISFSKPLCKLLDCLLLALQMPPCSFGQWPLSCAQVKPLARAGCLLFASHQFNLHASTTAGFQFSLFTSFTFSTWFNKFSSECYPASQSAAGGIVRLAGLKLGQLQKIGEGKCID
jgi:hypothetical protein